MQDSFTRWRNPFLFCLGLSVGTSFIMQWLASDFWLNDRKFSIPGLELFYSKKEVLTVLTQIKQPARIALNYQLIFDFVLMTGIYPGIASLCMMVREKITKQTFRTILFALAILQPVAWIFDIVENSYLLTWIGKPEIGNEFAAYHNIVAIKWMIALAGFFSAICLWVFSNRSKNHPLKI
ncbi:MAG: hypothetical protein ACHQF0_07520 [Chitinophagales bacterium]